MPNIENRLKRLEAAKGPPATVYVFADLGQTKDEVIARDYPNGAPEGLEVVVIRWTPGPHEEHEH